MIRVRMAVLCCSNGGECRGALSSFYEWRANSILAKTAALSLEEQGGVSPPNLMQ